MQTNEKSDKNLDFVDFFSDFRFLALDRNYFLWPGDYQEALLFLNAAPFCKSTSELISLIIYSNPDLLFKNQETVLFLEKL